MCCQELARGFPWVAFSCFAFLYLKSIMQLRARHPSPEQGGREALKCV